MKWFMLMTLILSSSAFAEMKGADGICHKTFKQVRHSAYGKVSHAKAKAAKKAAKKAAEEAKKKAGKI